MHVKSHGKRRLTLTLAVVVAFGIAGGIAYATIPSAGNVYNACMLKGIGTIRLIDKALPSTNLLSHCVDGKELEVSWNQSGPPGAAGPKGADGEKGDTGEQGPQGPAGALASLESVNGLACTRNGQAGTAQITYDANGVATITCVIANGPPSTVPPDAFNNSCASAINAGVLTPGETKTFLGTTSPAGTEDWFQVAFSGGPLQVTLTADPSIKFDIVGPCGSTLESGLTTAQVSSPSPFLIRVYGDAGVTGSWRLALSNT
jgi:hypothetical protein